MVLISNIGWKDLFLLTKKLRPELDILIAVDRITTGANSHNLRGLANAYVLACEAGQPSRAQEYRTHLLRELARRAKLASRRMRFVPKLRSC